MSASSRIVDQPAPIATAETPIGELVIADLIDRMAVGTERYGMPLTAHNGRDALVDAYQEAMDLTLYLRQAIEERSTREAWLAREVVEVARLMASDTTSGPLWMRLGRAFRMVDDSPICAAEAAGAPSGVVGAYRMRLVALAGAAVAEADALPGGEVAR